MSATNESSPVGFVAPSNGLAGGYRGDNVTILRAMTAFTAIAWYNAIEIIFLTFVRFKKYEGLYFYSMVTTAFAIIVYQLGSWGNMLQIYEPTLLFVIFQNIGWIFMIVGQSLVLYSRLHIITLSQKTLHFVLWMIIINSTLMYIPTTALNFLEIQVMNQTYADGYNTMERIQMTLFSVQEMIISAIYLWEVRRFIRSWEEGTRKLMYELVAVNVGLILLDVALLSVEYVDLYEIETTLKGMVYAIKLKLEIGVLSRMVKVVEDRSRVAVREEDIDLRKYSSAHTAREFFANPLTQSSTRGSRQTRQPKVSEDVGQIESGERPMTPESPPDVSTLDVPRPDRPEASRASSTQDLFDDFPGKITGKDG